MDRQFLTKLLKCNMTKTFTSIIFQIPLNYQIIYEIKWYTIHTHSQHNSLTAALENRKNNSVILQNELNPVIARECLSS